MAKRPTHTLLLLASDRTVRVDFGPGPKFDRLAERQMPPGAAEDPAQRAAVALAMGGTAGKSVWVLWDGAWTQTVDMPAAAVTGLTPEQLARSLGFEAEPLSGIPAGEGSALGMAAQPGSPSGSESGRQSYWIVQVAAGVRDGLEKAVSAAGGRLAGIVHPGGLPQAAWGARDRPAGEWRRVEVWDQTTLVLHGTADGAVSVRVVNARPGSPAWRGELPTIGPVGWMGRGTAPEIAGDDGSPVEWLPHALPADAVPADWLRAWAGELTAQPRRAPVAEPAPKPAGAGRLYAAGAGALAAVLAVCVAHGMSLKQQTETLKGKADKLEAGRALLAKATADGAKTSAAAGQKGDKELTDERDALRRKLETLRKDDDDLAAKLKKAEAAAADLRTRTEALGRLRAAQREAFPALLAALAAAEPGTENKNAKVLVRDVRNDNGKLKVTGICVAQKSANEFAAALKARLAPAGWTVEPSQTRFRELVGAAEVFDFAIVLSSPATPPPEVPAEKPGDKPAGKPEDKAGDMSAEPPPEASGTLGTQRPRPRPTAVPVRSTTAPGGGQ